MDKKLGFENLGKSVKSMVSMDDTAKGGLALFYEIFTVIPCAPKDLKR